MNSEKLMSKMDKVHQNGAGIQITRYDYCYSLVNNIFLMINILKKLTFFFILLKVIYAHGLSKNLFVFTLMGVLWSVLLDCVRVEFCAYESQPNPTMNNRIYHHFI